MSNPFRIVALVAAKDLRQRLRDRSAILVAIVAPLGLAFIFSRLLAGATEFHATYAFVDLDGGPMAATFREDVLGTLADDGMLTIHDATTENAARADVEAGTADAAFVLPEGFSAAIASGEKATIEVLGARNAGLATEVARAIAERYGDGVRGVELAVETVARLRGAPLGPEVAQVAGAAAAQAQNPPVALVDDATNLRQLSLSTYFSTSMAILFLFFSAQIGLVSLFEERRIGTLGRMLAGPVAPWSVLAGKTLGGVIQAAVSMTVLIVATTVLVGADWGPPIGVALVTGAAIVAATGLTALVTSFAKSADSAGAANSAVAITMGVLGGSFTPTSQAPEALNVLALLTPNGWFMRGLGDMAGPSGSLADGLFAAGVLTLFGLVTGAVGFARVRSLVRAR